MSRIAAVERIFDTLVGAGLSEDHSSFDDLVMGCLAAAVDPAAAGKEVITIIADLDEERTEEEVCMDLCDYRKASGSKQPIGVTIAQAVAAGRAGWERGYED